MIQKAEDSTQEIGISAQYGRVRGAEWFPLLYKRDVIVVGQGGIGSWLSAMLSRVGCNLYLYDDDSYEEHNLTGQFTTQKALGVNKAEATVRLIRGFSPDCMADAYPQKYTEDSMVNPIMTCGLDNMEARKVAFLNWKSFVEGASDEDKHKCFFQDGRLNPEQLQIFNIPGDRPDLIKKYEEEYLFDDKDVPDNNCTFKQTSHAAAMIASHMTGFMTNWAFNAEKGRMIR